MVEIQLIRGDITKLNADAIVNAANTSLLGGGGVDGAIHRAAGPDLLAACKLLNGCATGEAKLTEGFGLSSRYIIHTVGPVWQGGKKNEENLLASCYEKTLQIAQNKDLVSVAYPCISTGVYGFPKQLAAEVALRTIRNHLIHNILPTTIMIVCFDEENYLIYKKLITSQLKYLTPWLSVKI